VGNGKRRDNFMRISAVKELPLRSELVEIGSLFWSASVLKSEILSPGLATSAMWSKTTMPGEMIPSQSLRISKGCVRRPREKVRMYHDLSKR
jgi:hypothetical protein